MAAFIVSPAVLAPPWSIAQSETAGLPIELGRRSLSQLAAVVMSALRQFRKSAAKVPSGRLPTSSVVITSSALRWAEEAPKPFSQGVSPLTCALVTVFVPYASGRLDFALMPSSPIQKA